MAAAPSDPQSTPVDAARAGTKTMLFPAEGTSGAGTATGSSGNGGNSVTGTPQGAAQAQPTSEGGAAAQPARNWEQDYSQLEGRYKAYEKYGTPEQIENAIRWAQYGADIKRRIDAGEYVSKADRAAAAQAAQGAGQPATDPFDRWEELTPREQAKALRESLVGDIRKEVIDPFKQELRGQSAGITGEHHLLLTLVKQLIKNPNLEPADVLAKATEVLTQTPEKALEHVVSSMLEPQNREKAIADAVKQAREEERAKIQQEKENEAIKQFGGSRGGLLHLAPNKETTRRERREAVLRDVAKLAAGIS